MDALRRAETAGSEKPQETAQTTLPEAIEQPASNTPLQLEPLEAGVLAGNDGADDTPAESNETAAIAERTQTPPGTQDSRQQARSVLEALAARKSSARRRLVFAFSGLLSVVVMLAGYYFWTLNTTNHYQVATAGTLITTTSAPPPDVVAPDVPPTASAKTNRPVSAENPVPASTPALPEPAAQAATAGKESLVADDEARMTAGLSEEPVAQPRQDYRIEIHRTRQTARIPTDLQQGYQAYRAGDHARAENLYRQVLRTYPGNRDAMLGLAAIALHQGNRQVAGYYYEQLLKADPADKTALLALQGLSGGQYSLESGSKLKYWLQTEQNNAQLHFALGNQYAASGQWKEAQQSYFEAHRLAPASADYAFNLAISLDMLGHGDQALGFYLQARELAGQAGALFNTAQLDKRISQLQAAAESAR